MKRFIPLAALALISTAAQAEPAVAPGNTLLTVSASGHSTREPDLAVFRAGVTTQAATARQALATNSAAMNKAIAALKQAGIADKDIQTSNLSVNPTYGEHQTVTGYQASNSVMVRQRQLADYGTVIDTLVAAGANQVSGPNFELADSQPALDEARTQAIAEARSRAQLYAKAAGLKVARILSISESGGYAPSGEIFVSAMRKAAAAPVQPGELDLTANVTVQFELTPL